MKIATYEAVKRRIANLLSQIFYCMVEQVLIPATPTWPGVPKQENVVNIFNFHNSVIQSYLQDLQVSCKT